MTIFSIIIILAIIFIALVYVWKDEDRKEREKMRLASKRLRLNNSQIVAICECGANLLRINRETEMNFTPFVNGVWPKPLKEGEIFLRCVNGCDKFAECPIRKRLSDRNGCHELGLADGVRIVKSCTFDQNGTAYFILERDFEHRKILVDGEVYEGNDKSLCFVRANTPDDVAENGKRETDDASSCRQ